jgi:hypothetical protein
LILTTNDPLKKLSENPSFSEIKEDNNFSIKGNFEIRYIDNSGLNFEVETNTLIAIFDRNKSLAIKFKETKDNSLDSFS